MTAYAVTQQTEDGYDTYDVLTFRADLAQAASPVEIQGDSGWESTPFQVADCRHSQREAARLLMEWIGLDGECYSTERPFDVKEVSDGDQ
jgi:hypothetical protein